MNTRHMETAKSLNLPVLSRNGLNVSVITQSQLNEIKSHLHSDQKVHVKQDSQNLWAQRIQNQRKQKEQEKYQKFILEEEERRRVDQIEEEFQQKLKNDSILDANQKIFNNRADVRTLKSKMLLSELETTNKQLIDIQQQFRTMKAAYEEQYQEDIKYRADEALDKEIQLQQMKDNQRRQTFQEVKKQFNEQKESRIKEYIKDMQEGRLIQKAAEEEVKQKQINAQLEKKRKLQLLQEQNDFMEAKQRMLMEQEALEAKEAQIRQEYEDHKAQVNAMRAQREHEKKSKQLNMKQHLFDIREKQIKQQQDDYMERIEKVQQEQLQKQIQIEELKVKERLMLLQEQEESRSKQIEMRSQQNILKQQEADQEQVLKMKAITQLDSLQKVQEDILKKRNKELQQFQKMQIVHHMNNLEEDFINLKFFKLFLASLPIQPSSVIELDQILIKEKLIEEFKQKIQLFLPNFKQKELNQQYCEELAHQLKNKGYFIELEDGLIKTECVSRKELKEIIKKGCQDQYLVEDVINQINQSVSNNKEIDLKKFMRSQHDKLYKALEKYQTAQQIKYKFQNLLRQSHMQIEYPPQLDNTAKLLQQGKLCVDYQSGKITKDQLQELIQLASKNNITFNTITVIEDLLEELANLESNGVFEDIFQFQITSEILNNKVIYYWRDQFIQLLRENCKQQLNQGKQIVLQNEILDHINAIVKEEPLKQAYDKYLEITRQIKNATPSKQIDLINSSPFLSQLFIGVKNQFEFQVNTQKKLEGPISLKELEEIKAICAEHQLPLVTQAREDQIHAALKLITTLHFNLTAEEIEPLYAYRSKELNLFIYNLIAQQDFLKQFHQILYDSTDTIPNMIERCSVYRDQELNIQSLRSLKLVDNIHPDIEAVVTNYKRALWKSEAQECLQNLIDPQKAQQLLNQDNQDERLRRKLQNVVDQYAEWVTQFNQIEIDMADPKPNNKLIQLINSHIYIPDAYHKQLWYKYMQILWAQKAHSFIQERASACSLRTLKRVAEILQIPQCAILQKLTTLMEQTEELQNKVKEYYDQRNTWGRNREKELAQLKGYKSYHRYIESKADARYISKLYSQCQDAPSLKVKEMYEDIQEIKVIIAQFNELVTNEPDNNTYLERLLKIRQYYTMQFLKVKGFNLMLMYNLIKQQSLYNVKSLTPSHELTERLDEISVLIALGGDEWYQKFSQSYRPTKQSEEFKIVDNSLTDDFEWVKWLEQDSVQDFSAKKVKKQIKIQKKAEIKVTVDEEERNASRNLIQGYLKKYNQKFSDSQIRMLETQIFMENNQNKAQYEKEFLKIKFVLKQKKIQDLNYQTIKKLYKNLVQQKRSSGLGLKLESVNLIPKLEVQRSSSKIQTEVISQVPMEDIEIRLPLNEPEPEPPQQLFQELNEEILYPEQVHKQKKQLYSIGDIQIQITKKSSTDKHSYVIQPALLTYDISNSNKFPPLDISINCDSYSPAANAVEFFQSKKNLIIGWVYSKTLAHAGDLFKLADKLKQNKQCVGCKKDNFGITLIYYEYLSKLKPTTKWILYQEELSNQPLMSSLQKYSNLEKFKPHLCFVLYGKENKICENPMLPLKIDYVNIYKIQNFAKVIEHQKQSKKKNNEPKEIHEMIMDIPNIQSLLG